MTREPMAGSRPAPIVIAHRGASGYRPEHSRSAYELAIALGADAVEPDIVPTRDGVLVVRHENEISGTTDIAAHPEFADRRTTKTIDGESLTGWFTEDFTWDELSRLRVVERLPKLRQHGTTFDGREPMLRLRDVRDIVDAASARLGRTIVMVAELKHATYFASVGLPLDELFSAEMGQWATGDNLVMESFEQSVLVRTRERGVAGRLVFLAEASGSPADLVAADGAAARSYADHLTDAGLARLAADVDGVSVDVALLLHAEGDEVLVGDIVERAHAVGLGVFCWTLRAENHFLLPPLRRGTRAADWGDWAAQFGLIMRSGIDGVFADQPDLALTVRATL